MNLLEISANVMIAFAIFLAGRNHVYTWPTGIIGCALFALLFFQSQLYAQVTLQAFFILTSIIGWRLWSAGATGQERPIGRAPLRHLIFTVTGALVVAAIYTVILRTYSDAFEPAWDSLIMVMSVIGQILLMQRKLENWVFWIITNTIAVPLFFTRGLELTALLYAAYWVHAIYALYRWRQEYQAQLK